MKIRPYLHLVFWTVSLGILALFTGLGAYRSGYLAASTLGIVSAAIILTAIWSVFGPGEYWKRFAASHCFGLALMLLMIYGLVRRPPPNYPFDGIGVGKSALLAAFAHSVAAQIPLWFFRSILGWRLIHPSDQSQRPFSLRDILFGSLIVGLAIVSAEQSVRVQAEYHSRYFWPDAIPGEKTEMPVLGNDGVYRMTEVVADPIQIEKTRIVYVQQQTRESLAGFGIGSILFGVISLLSVPFLRCAMLPRKFGFPYGSWAMVILGQMAIVTIWYFVVQRLPFVYSKVVSYMPLWYGVTMAVLVVVVFSTRHKGFAFTSDIAQTRGKS